ncbi:MAG: hypothetical protein AAF682_22235 [Planctomycetota bacterium]
MSEQASPSGDRERQQQELPSNDCNSTRLRVEVLRCTREGEWKPVGVTLVFKRGRWFCTSCEDEWKDTGFGLEQIGSAVNDCMESYGMSQGIECYTKDGQVVLEDARVVEDGVVKVCASSGLLVPVDKPRRRAGDSVDEAAPPAASQRTHHSQEGGCERG